MEFSLNKLHNRQVNSAMRDIKFPVFMFIFVVPCIADLY